MKLLVFIICIYGILCSNTINESINTANSSKTQEIPNALFYSKNYLKQLEDFYLQVSKGAKSLEFVSFRQQRLIDLKNHLLLGNDFIKKHKIMLVLASFYISMQKDSIRYSENGGVSVKITLSQELDEKNPSEVYLSFNGVYLSDLELLKQHKIKAFAYCNTIWLTNCMLIGIGEQFRK